MFVECNDSLGLGNDGFRGYRMSRCNTVWILSSGRPYNGSTEGSIRGKGFKVALNTGIGTRILPSIVRATAAD